MGFVINSIVTVNQAILASDFGMITANGGVANAAVTMASAASILNDGFVSNSDAAVAVNGANTNIENHGSLTGGGSVGVIDAYTGIAAGGTYLLLTNYGSISTRGTQDASCLFTKSGGNFITNLGSMVSHFDTTIELSDEFSLGLGNRVINH